jgi:hypothetical protein
MMGQRWSAATVAAGVGLCLALAAGIVLRLIWAEDMEYKTDEVWTFEHTRDTDLARQVPWVGMNSSINVPNPGMSLWIFVALRIVSRAETPPELARAVQLANCLALVLLVVFALRSIPRSEREPWLWAAALVAVNPLVVLFHRKLWPPCVLPLLTLAVLWAWRRRERFGYAFVWGLVGACLGQIHMAGFFFAGGFALWALLFDRRGVAWKGWLLGSILGALPMLPWLPHLMHPSPDHPSHPSWWLHALEGKFWLRWCTEPFGIGIDYALGPYFSDFLTWPHIAGTPTYLIGVVHLVLLAATVVVLMRGAAALWQQRGRLVDAFIGRDSPTAFTLSAALWGFGLLMTVSCLPIHRHYMIVLFPLECLWVARLAVSHPEGVRLGRRLLATLCVGQLVVSASFLAYVHQTQLIDAEYGPTYHAQQPDRNTKESTHAAGSPCSAAPGLEQSARR